MAFSWEWFWLTDGLFFMVGYAIAIAAAIAHDKYKLALGMGLFAAVVFCIVGGLLGGQA